MYKRDVLPLILIGILLACTGCDSGDEGFDEHWDLLLGDWTLVSFQGTALPIQLPEFGQSEILESGDLSVAADTTWQMRLNGSNANAAAGGDWVITLSGEYIVADHSVTFTTAACIEIGANPECPASISGAEISAWNWTETQLPVNMQVGDQLWSLGFAK